MLEIRPNCELCDQDLKPTSPDAMICTYECTFCADCVEKHLKNVYPKCGGDLQRRPIRPKTAWRPERKLGLQNHPASQDRFHTPFTLEEITEFSRKLASLAPEER